MGPDENEVALRDAPIASVTADQIPQHVLSDPG